MRAVATADQVAQRIVFLRDSILRAESAKVTDEDHFSRSVWHGLAREDRLQGAKAYDLGLTASWSIDKNVGKFGRKAPAHSSFSTLLGKVHW